MLDLVCAEDDQVIETDGYENNNGIELPKSMPNYSDLLNQQNQALVSVPIKPGVNLAIYHDGSTGVHDNDGYRLPL